MESLENRVEKGARRLDEHCRELELQPWAEQIDVQTMDMGDCQACILGQLAGSYWHGLDEIFQAEYRDYINADDQDEFVHPGETYGFTLGDEDDNPAEYQKWAEAWNRLNWLWREQIRARLMP